MDCLYRLEKTTHEGRSEEEKTADASVEAINFFSGLLSGIETELMYMMKIYRERCKVMGMNLKQPIYSPSHDLIVG